MSLEDLLAAEGFKRKAKMIPRHSFGSDGRSIPLYPTRGKHEPSSSSSVKRTARTRSEIPRKDSRGDFSTSYSLKGRNPRDDPNRREKIDWESKTETRVELERRGYKDSWDAKKFSLSSSEDSRGFGRKETVESNEIVEVENNKPYTDIYSYDVHKNEERERHRQHSGEDAMEDKRTTKDSFKRVPRQRILSVNSWKRVNQPEINMISEKGKTFDESRSLRQGRSEQILDTPALDEAAVKAMISILSGYVKRFLTDGDFRTSLRHNSFASLNFIGLEEGLDTECKIIENLEQAIEMVERAAEENATAKELKKASLQLSVITGLNSNDLKDGLTSGIPNFKLSACAHLYLSMIYMLQRKDRIAAKHLLQVFCDSPFQARTTLLPDLWDQILFPHLSDLKLWYDKEADSLADSPIPTNLKLLDKVYNETLDSATYQFALYYKDWLTEGVDAPSLPSIAIPSFSVHPMQKGHTCSPTCHFSPHPMVSKKLYDEVFKHSHKSGIEIEVYEEEDFEINAISSNGTAPEDKQLILYSDDSVKHKNQNISPGGKSHPDDSHAADETQRLEQASSSGELNFNENFHNSQWLQENSDVHTLQELPPAKENELLTKRPAKSLLDHAVSISLETKLKSPVHELQKSYEDFSETTSLLSIPKDFICPLNGLLFEDPVTLETGHTFERGAITDWFGRESKTCPVTGKTLAFQAVPPTNFILKRVIDNWKVEHCRNLLATVSQLTADSSEHVKSKDDVTMSLLEQFLIVFTKDERIANAKQLISFGGLQFLLRRFEYGDVNEKTSILELLSCCIESDASCRDDVARSINMPCLLELIRSEQLKLRTNAVLMLAELICLNRRKNAEGILKGLQDAEIINAMDNLLIYMQTCVLEERPEVAVLILHFDLLKIPHESSLYRQEAVDALTTALESGLSDPKVQKKCCRALLILGGRFSLSGKLMTEDWSLKLAGFLNGPDWNFADNEDNNIATDETVMMIEDEEEVKTREKWLVSVSASLLGDGTKSFLETVSKCLTLGNSDLVRVILTTGVWLSSSLASLSDTEFQLSALFTLITPLKFCLEYGELVEQKVLASMCLLNFSKIPGQ
ncbi:E3 ubiquitin- ligase LIN-1 isoform X1 [Olea europaea subsp. europaea]|uniref:RING-type E3 ubiquitin transferase n=1 Tax=Olea europaea subsp. europaea TaxID=158383 RepID=A0A8S0QE27_OLEEU|nr:E3 ubiquitin- ligase LIN-1 isoform X1 [Olea europaea subsp. europaea]